MKLIASLVTVATLATVTSCANPSLVEDARGLRDDLRGLSGVAQVRLGYDEPITLDSGKVALFVTMDADASVDDVVAVTETAYAAFRGTHRSEEADLDIAFGDSTVHLRSFEPEASVAAVTGAALTGLSAAGPGERVIVDLNTQDVARGDHVDGTYLVLLAEGSDTDDVLPALDAIATDGLFGWGVRAADGSGLSFDRGIAPADVRRTWTRVQSARLPVDVRAFGHGAVLVEGELPASIDVSVARQRRALDEITHAQIEALVDHSDGAWSYDLSQGEAWVAFIDRSICDDSRQGPYDRELEAWVLDRWGPCVPAQ